MFATSANRRRTTRYNRRRSAKGGFRRRVRRRVGTRKGTRRRRVAGKKRSRGLATTIGGALGGLAGSYFGPAGAAIGGILGRAGGRVFRKVTGQGTYKIKHNTVMGIGSAPLTFGDNEISLKHRECIGNIRSSVGFAASVFRVNPGDEATFPWLPGIAHNFQQWIPEGIIFEFVSTSGDALSNTNTALGRVVIASEYNVAGPTQFTTTQAMYQTEFTNSCKPSTNMVHGLECKPSTLPVPILFVREGPLPAPTQLFSSNDLRFSDLANVTVATEGQQEAGVVIGQLWVTYHIRLLKKQMPQVDDYAWTDMYRLPAHTFTAAQAHVAPADAEYGSQLSPWGTAPIPNPDNDCGTMLVSDTASGHQMLAFYPSTDPTTYLINMRVNYTTFGHAGSVSSTGLTVAAVGGIVKQVTPYYTASGVVSPSAHYSSTNPVAVGAGWNANYNNQQCYWSCTWILRVGAFAGDSLAQRIAQGAFVRFAMTTVGDIITFGAGTQILITTLSDKFSSSAVLGNYAEAPQDQIVEVNPDGDEAPEEVEALVEAPLEMKSMFSVPVEETKIPLARSLQKARIPTAPLEHKESKEEKKEPLPSMFSENPRVHVPFVEDMPGHFGLSDDPELDDDDGEGDDDDYTDESGTDDDDLEVDEEPDAAPMIIPRDPPKLVRSDAIASSVAFSNRDPLKRKR